VYQDLGANPSTSTIVPYCDTLGGVLEFDWAWRHCGDTDRGSR